MIRAYAENAVIINDNGANVTYRGQSPKCGEISYVTGMDYCSDYVTANIGYHTCPKCNYNYPIVLHRGR